VILPACAPTHRVVRDDALVGSIYEIVVRGELGPTVAHAFDGLALEPRDCDTAIVGQVADQAELAGILRRIHDLGLTLVSVAPRANGESHAIATGRAG
jgi:hypothetical protein